jgi:mannan endo-1,6-alpha-mannosidase
MLTYKGIAIRSLASVAQLVPSLSDRILPVLQSSAEAAVSKCADSDSHLLCGFYWVGHGEDDAISARQQMNALSAVASLLIADAEAPSSSLEEPSHGDGIDTEGSAPTEMPNEGIRRSAIGPTVFVLMVSGLVAARWVGLVA